jgi:CheY-like chemotaxis protein
MARILFIDDDLDTLRLMNSAVVLFGHHALLASSGQVGLLVAGNEAPDMIMIDMRLCDMDGIAVIRLIRSNPPIAGIPIVVISASPADGLADKARAAGAKEYLQKPIQLQTLQDVIQKYTNGKK